MFIKTKNIFIASTLFLVVLILSLAMVSAATINVDVKDTYNETSEKYDENGFNLANATIQVTNSDDVSIYTGITGNDGKLSFTLNPGTYTLNISYSTYLARIQELKITSADVVVPVSHTFVPDILFLVYYDGHSNKINKLMEISKRVVYINSMDLEDISKKEWLLNYAQFIYVDMYAENMLDYDASILKGTPADDNYKIAYCYGVYTDDLLQTINLNFIGGELINTPHTIENTFIGSYFGAYDQYGDICDENMQNLFDYIIFLLKESTDDPTQYLERIPQIGHTWGIYHPDFGCWENPVNSSLIREWIRNNPGYVDYDEYGLPGDGSLNWYVTEFKQWQEEEMELGNFDFHTAFEKWYNENENKSHLTSNYVVIASYGPQTELIDSLIRGYEVQGRAAFNVFQIGTSYSMANILVNLMGQLTRNISAINSLYSWSMDYENMADGGAIDEFTQMNLEVIRAVQDISEYSYMSKFGPQAEWTYAVTIPSFEGVFGAIAASYKDGDGKEHVIQSGVDKIVETTLGWVNLKEKQNSEKNVAVVLYNYPPGKSEIGASYLDVFQSLHDLLEHMLEEGYNIGFTNNESIPNATELYTLISAMGNKGSWAQGYLNKMVEDNFEDFTEHGQLVNFTKYLEYFNSLNSTLQDQLVGRWGSGLGDIMVYNNSSIVIPGLFFGNVFITFQPSRGWEEQDVENYHNLTLPPHQQYVTFYKWLGDTVDGFGADAMIHLGTHGTLEFLPGRSIGLQADDWTFELMGIPNIYPYIVSNPGEALVARERAGALVISHMTPATVISELYLDLIQMYSNITNYKAAVSSGVLELADEYKGRIIELAEKLYIDGPVDDDDETFDIWLDKLHHLLEDLDNDIITLGLHSLGYVLEGDAMVQEVITIVSSKTYIYEDIKNLLYPDIEKSYYEMLHSANDTYINKTKEIQAWLTNFVTNLEKINPDWLKDPSFSIDTFTNGITSGSDFYESLLLCRDTINSIRDNMEWKSIMNALSGGYVLPGLAADPSYGDSLPTGRSIYSMDVTKMPSTAAWEAAKKIVDKLLVDYYEEHGNFPDLVGLVMWGTELLRTEGIGIAEFLYFLGVQPKWAPNGAVGKTLELIELKDLNVTLSNGTTISRPRIDVFASAVTSNTNWIKLMVDAVALAYSDDEDIEMNFVRQYVANYTGNSNPFDRVFGLPGAVLEGTGMSNYIPNTNKWETSTTLAKDLADLYLSRVSYAWSIDSNGKLTVNQNEELYKYLLSNVDLITQNIDSTWRFLDSDDYYDWFGGMLAASLFLGGTPDTAIVDIRNKNDMVSRTLQEQLEFEIRSTILNPMYQDALLGDSPAGWLEYARKYENIFGFAVLTNGTSVTAISNNLWNALAQNILDSRFDVNANYKSDAFQSMAGFLIQASRSGLWEADSKMLNDLINKFVDSAIDYGFACCHHTCANINCFEFILESYQKSDSYDAATTATRAALFQDRFDEMSGITSTQSINNLEGVDKAVSGQTGSNKQSSSGGKVFSNFTGSKYTSDSQSASGSSSQSSQSYSGSTSQSSPVSAGSNGQGSPSSGGSGSSASSSGNFAFAQSSANDGQAEGVEPSNGLEQGDAGSDSGSAYEVSESESQSGQESNVSIAFLAVVLATVALFVVGYLRNKKNSDY